MKKILSYSFILLGASIVVASCTKDRLQEARTDVNINNEDLAQVRFIHALSSNSINTVSPVVAATAPPALNFFVNGVRLNAISSATQTFTSVYGGAFPGAAILVASNANGNNVFDYAAIPAGSSRVTGAMFRLIGASAADSVVSTTFTFDKWKKYTVIAADTIPNQRFYAFEDVFVTPDTGNYAIRFINLGINLPTGITVPAALDVFSTRRQANIISNIPYRGSSAFVESRVANLFNNILFTTDTLLIRTAGTTTTVAQVNGFFPVRTRVYTFVARGVSTIAGTRTLAVNGYLNR